MSISGPVPKNWLRFSYIGSEDYELIWTLMVHNNKKSDHTSNDEVKLFCGNIVVIEEEWFDDMNWTDDATFSTALIKREKLDSIKK